eukprot:1149659-Pelagomonas_calceolata.AAC.1
MEMADMGIGTTEKHMFFILYVIRITGITDWRSTPWTKQPVQLEECELGARSTDPACQSEWIV